MQILHPCNSLNLSTLTAGVDTEVVIQPKPKSTWRPSHLEKRVGQAARLTAEREAARVPWPQLQEAREKCARWEALALWVRAIEDTEGDFPQGLARAVEKRCRGLSKFVEEQKHEYSDGLPSFWYHPERWINEYIFGKPWREGWVNAVGYYAARDPACLRNHAYRAYCERQRKRSRPVACRSFRD